MSDIMLTLQSPLPWADKRAFLLSYRYQTPARCGETVPDADVVLESDPSFNEPGTWDEVRRARNFGIITNDQYLEVAQALGTRRG